jgi:mono/diheme cytochrome c family protein
MTLSRILLLVPTALAIGSFSVSPAQADSPNNQPPGYQIYMANNCYQCHGTVGQGGTGPTIVPPRLLPQPKFMAFVRNPSPPNMPPYTTAVLSDADLASIWSYLHALPPPNNALPEALKRLQSVKTQGP